MELWLLNNLSTLELAVLLVGGVIAVALAGSVLAHRRYPQLTRGHHNDMVGVVLGMFGAIYGIILAFVVVTLWTTLQETETVIAAESSDLVQVIRNARVLPAEEQAELSAAVGDYVHAVVDRQWPRMRTGTADFSVAQRQVDRIYTVLQSYEPATERQKVFYEQAVGRLDDVVTQRRARLSASSQELPLLLKVLVYGGALVIVPLTFLYGNESRRARLLFVGSVAALIGFSLLLVLALDRPFAGDISVSPEPFTSGILAQYW